MRGRPDFTPLGVEYVRIIPAHAGQTGSQTVLLRCLADHPRACGANLLCRLPRVGEFGSSPRMRGKRHCLSPMYSCRRIIPAHAGQTASRSQARTLPTDHPRACGANYACCSASVSPYGSSPRMRGKLALSLAPCPGVRIIPAHAGQTGGRWRLRRARPDHPRACGANTVQGAAFAGVVGSSPRMRGKHVLGDTPFVRIRIIPAHAGQTSTPMSVPCSISDHPRACGANRPVHDLYKS